MNTPAEKANHGKQSSMEKRNTKQEILEVSLELLCVQGLEGTSIAQIANAVGIRKASLYSHFESNSYKAPSKDR